MTWIIWLILAAVLGVVELLTVTLTLGLIAVAAAVAAVVGALGVPVPLQIVAFVLAAGAAWAWSGPSPSATSSSPRRCEPGQPRWSAAVPWSSRKLTDTTGGSASAARNGPPAPTTRPS